MAYRVFIVPSAEKEMARLENTVHNRISKKILTLQQNPRPRGVRKLTGKEQYRLRIGDYRVLYTVDEAVRIIVIIAVGHRRDIYR